MHQKSQQVLDRNLGKVKKKKKKIRESFYILYLSNEDIPSI